MTLMDTQTENLISRVFYDIIVRQSSIFWQNIKLESMQALQIIITFKYLI